MNNKCPKCKEIHYPFCSLEAGKDYAATDCRDASQGIGFVYGSVAEIKRTNDELNQVLNTPKPPPLPEKLSGNETDSYTVRIPQGPTLSQTISPDEQYRQRAEAISQIKQNLDRLQTLHNKLAELLTDIEGKKK